MRKYYLLFFLLFKCFWNKSFLGQLFEKRVVLDGYWLWLAILLDLQCEFLCLGEGLVFCGGVDDGIAVLWCYSDDAHGELAEGRVLEALGMQHLLQVAAWILDDALLFADLADADPGDEQGAPDLGSLVSPAVDGGWSVAQGKHAVS